MEFCMSGRHRPNNQTVVQYIEKNQSPWKTLTIISGLLNAVLAIVIGLLQVCAVGHKISRGRSQEELPTAYLQQTQFQLESNEPQYAEVDFSKLHKTFRHNQVNSTYAALKLPKS